MARFYTSASNSRGNTTTAQGLKTGQTVHTRGWSTGVRIVSRPSDSHPDTRDMFDVYATSGSHGGHGDVYLGRLRETWSGNVEWLPADWAGTLDADASRTIRHAAAEAS